MTQYWLNKVDLSKISDLSNLLINEGYKVMENDTDDFAQQFEPRAWDGDKRGQVWMNTEANPIFIETYKNAKDPDEKQIRLLIGKIIKVVGAKEVVDANSEPYDLNLFTESPSQYNH